MLLAQRGGGRYMDGAKSFGVGQPEERRLTLLDLMEGFKQGGPSQAPKAMEMTKQGGLDQDPRLIRPPRKIPGKQTGSYLHLIGPNQVPSDANAMRAAWGVPPSSRLQPLPK